MVNKIESCLMEGSDSEREVRTTEYIKAGELLLSVPRSCLLTSGHGRRSRFGIELGDERLRTEASYLALAVLEEIAIGVGSATYEHHIRHLPTAQALRHLPLMWSDAELEELVGSPLLTRLAMQRTDIEADFSSLTSHSHAFATLVSRDLFLWCHAVVTSR